MDETDGRASDYAGAFEPGKDVRAPDAVRDLIGVFPAAAALLDDEARVLSANERFVEALGLAATAYAGQSVEAVVARRDRETAEWTVLQDGGEGTPLRLIVRTLGPSCAPGRFLVIAEPVEPSDPVAASDYRDFVENAPFGVFRATPNGRILDANPALAAMLGYESVEQLRDVELAQDVFSRPEHHRRFVAFQRQRGRVVGLELPWLRRNGKLLRTRLTSRALFDHEGHMQAYECVAEDVTGRRGMEEQLRQAQKMEAVGRLAGGIVHDFNNLLTVILGYSGLLNEEGIDEELRAEAAREIGGAAERAARLTRQLLTFSRKQPRAPENVDANEAVRDFLHLVRRLIGEDIHVVTALDAHRQPVRVDRGQLEQVLMNLVVNARDAMPDGGTIELRTERVELDQVHMRENADARAGPHVRIVVRDTGIGMDAATRSRIFEPFFTTKERGKGTGLGLATVYGIVVQSEGHLEVESEPGVGTSFLIYLPLAEADDADAPATQQSDRADASGGAGCVLLVEDEDGMRALTLRLLRRAGYRVLEAADADEAEEWLGQRASDIDLMLTDVVMPGRSGVQLARHVERAHPHIRVLFMSGYNDERLGEHGLQDSPALVEKPFTPRVLLGKVKQALRGELPTRTR